MSTIGFPLRVIAFFARARASERCVVIPIRKMRSCRSTCLLPHALRRMESRIATIRFGRAPIRSGPTRPPDLAGGAEPHGLDLTGGDREFYFPGKLVTDVEIPRIRQRLT